MLYNSYLSYLSCHPMIILWLLSQFSVVWCGRVWFPFLRGGEKVAGEGRGGAANIVVNLVGQGFSRLSQLVYLLLEVSDGLVKIISPSVGLAVS